MSVRKVVSCLQEVVCENKVVHLWHGTSLKRAGEVFKLLNALGYPQYSTEVFIVLLLNGQHELFGLVEASVGTMTSSLVHPREIFGPAIRQGAAAIIVAHNHPSGDPTPSSEDREVTTRLVESGQLLGIPCLDHLILGDASFLSIRQERPDLF